MFAIQAQEKTGDSWNSIDWLREFDKEFTFAADAILWARNHMSSEPEGGMIHYRWAVVNLDTNEEICTV